MDPKQNLIGSLAHWVRMGKLEAGPALSAIQKLTLSTSSPQSPLALLELVSTETDPDLQSLAANLRLILRAEALRFYQRRQQGQAISKSEFEVLGGLPADPGEPWRFDTGPLVAVEKAVWTARELGLLLPLRSKAPRLFAEIQSRLAQQLRVADSVIVPRLSQHGTALMPQLETCWPKDVPGRDITLARLKTEPEHTRFATLRARFLASNRKEKEEILDVLCSWPTPAAGLVLHEMVLENWARDRATLALTMRFGEPVLRDWNDWMAWCANQFELWKAEEPAVRALVEQQCAGLLLILYSQLPQTDSAVFDSLLQNLCASTPRLELSGLVRSWSPSISLVERQALLGGIEAVPPLIAPPIIAAFRPALPAEPLREIPVASEPPAPPKPSLWERHIQPLFVENWYIVAGIAMVIFGSSLLAYYTWDKHWLVRYTIMPALLAFFTWSLAATGRWIEKKASEFKSTADMLRAAAIGLLPINFMAMALLSADEKVPHKGPVLLVMALIYFSIFGWSLRQWCAAVEPSLRHVLAGALLILNGLVAVAPLARTVGHLEGRPLLICLGAGFYLGFAVTAATIVYFVRRILTQAMAEEKRVPWFVAATLAITYLQVFLWVHGFMRHVPRPHTYALLVIGTGWLILFSERRALQWRNNPQLHGGESFLGFAMVLLGVLMGFSEPGVRVVSFMAAGGVWLYQALGRKHPLHYWIALTFFGLGMASIGLLPRFPGRWLPLLGLLAAGGYGAAGWWSEKRNQGSIAGACRGMQVAALFVTAVVAPLVQWHYQSKPWVTAVWLAAVAAVLAWRALKEQKLHWLHASLVVLALMLPYSGFADMAGRTPHHQTMVFGLALLSSVWLAVTAWFPKPLILAARSTVLWFYGSLAVAAMLLRLALGDVAPDPLWYRDYMDYTGPILMMMVLVVATYFSRSLVPAGMAVTLMVILFPELRANLRQTFTFISWGSGFGSSIWGLLLVWLCFFVRRWPVLKSLPEGDRFMGRHLFPFRRYDHTLFTWPLVAAAVFLIVKVDTVNLVRNQLAGGVPLKTAWALMITGVTWTFLAIYFREQRGAVIGVHLGWLWILAGVNFAYWRQADDPHWSWPFLVTGVLLQGLYFLYRFYLEPTHAWVRRLLTEPTRLVLKSASLVLAVVCIIALCDGAEMDRLQWLYAFVAAQLAWHALKTRHVVFGAVLFFHLWIGLLAVTAPGSGMLWLRVSISQSLTPTLWFLISIQIIMLVLEFLTRQTRHRESLPSDPQPSPTANPSTDIFLRPLVIPPFVIASLVAVGLGLAGLLDGLHGLILSSGQQILLLGTLLLTARAHVSGVILLIAMLLGYVVIERAVLTAPRVFLYQLDFLLKPWRLAVFALTMVLLAQAGRRIRQWNSWLLTGAFAQPGFYSPSPGWIFWPATIFAATAAVGHTLNPGWREAAVQLWAPYLGAITFGLVAWFWLRAGFYIGAGTLLVLGNIHLVRVFAGEFLQSEGLSELHLICLGIGLSLLQASVLRRTVRNSRAIAAINQWSLLLAGLILLLLSANYFTDPDLTTISWLRFLISGTLAWLAGRYFRRVARSPGPGEEAYAEVCEAAYHFALVLAIWCAALLVPWFRRPFFTLIALGLPMAYFYFRTEAALRAGLAEARRYRNSAAVLGFVVLGLYVFKGVFHMVLFPDVAISTQHYHYNAPMIMLVGVVLLRLHGLGGTSWLAFYGGLALMIGSYFLLTALPGLSPFHHPLPSAWCAIGLGHFWMLVSYARSPIRTAIQRLARLDENAWHQLRRGWGNCLLAGTQAAVLWGLADYIVDSYGIAPLLVGAASIFVHQAIIRCAPVYLVPAGLEVAIALHMDFLIPSYLPKDQVIWAIVLIWLALLVTHQIFKFKTVTVGGIVIVLAILVLAHVVYHDPWSTVGLWAIALGALFAAWTPQSKREPANPLEKVGGALLLWTPAWLVYFSQAPFANRGMQPATHIWAILATTSTIFVIGVIARLFPTRMAPAYHRWTRSEFRLFDSTMVWMERSGLVIHQVILWLSLLIALLLQLAHYNHKLALREFGLLTALELALAIAWGYEGKRRQSLLAYYLMQLSAAACFLTIRRYLMLSTGVWNYEYDVWASLAFSLTLVGARQIHQFSPRAVQVPLLSTMFALPLLALAWVLFHGLGVNLALLVVGLHSAMFAYLGKEERESPYNIIALGGFVAFVLITFYFKFQFRAIHAYIIPVGLGVLLLQELFRTRTTTEVRNWVRLLTLMAMLGSSGYYALADPRHAITFNLTMIVLCLLAMGLGSFLQIRLYLALGFAGLMVDLLSLLYKVLVQMERSSRMTVIGSLVLLIGAVLVFGAIFYKTHRESFDNWISKWRGKFVRWE